VTAPFRFDGDLPHLVARRRTLPCGLEVVIHPDATVPQIAVSVWYRVGSSDERADRTGLAHLFEHLFKGPAVRRAGHHHYDVLKRAGVTDANASTGPDRTAYYEVLPSNQLELALWIESDRMGYFAAGFDAERLATQQSVVRAERRQRYDNVPYGAERFAIAAAMYPEGHPSRYLTIGRHEDIQAATVDDVLDFYRTWYVPANATLVVAGDLPANLDALIDRYFGSFPKSTRPTRPVPATVTPAEARLTVDDRFAALARIHRAWHGPPAYGADEPALDVLATAWSSVGTGALWRRLVYETQLAQRVSAWTTNGRIGGEFHVAVDLRTGSDAAAVRAILDEECARGVDQLAVDRAVTRREASSIWGLTALARRVGTLQRYTLYTEQPDGMADDLLRYRAVTPASIDAAIARWLPPAQLVEVETLPKATTAPASAA
jgi:predicted Zn-dependent peptidase